MGPRRFALFRCGKTSIGEQLGAGTARFFNDKRVLQLAAFLLHEINFDFQKIYFSC